MPGGRGPPCPRRLVGRVLLPPAILPEKCHDPLPEHIERSQKRGKQSDSPVNPAAIRTGEGLKQNCVFTEESRQWPEPSDGKRSGGHSPERPRDLLAQPTHLAHVLLAANRMDYRAGGKKQESFEKRMRHQMEDAHRKLPHAAGQKHVTKLR